MATTKKPARSSATKPAATKAAAKKTKATTAKKPSAKRTAGAKTAAKPAAKRSTAKAAASKRPAAKAAKTTPAKAPPTKASRAKKAETPADEVTLDRRGPADDRREEEAAKAAEAPKLERRKKVNRRRQIDPTTCERDYSDSEVAFMNAMDDYKRRSGRMFPTCSEVLEVIRDLGYVQLSPAEKQVLDAAFPPATPAAEDTIEASAEQEALDALEDSDDLRVD